MSARRKAYYAYLESAHWRELRKAAFNRDGYKCVFCGSPKKLRGHHLKYRKDFRLCTVDDIQTLCDDCHNALHKKMAAERRANRARSHNRHMIKLIWGVSADEAIQRF